MGLPGQPPEDGFALPDAVRRCRTWQLREAKWHLDMARIGHYRRYNIEAAARCRQYARNIVDRWRRLGKVPLVTNRTTAEVLACQALAHAHSLDEIRAKMRAEPERKWL